jgi:SAM-dependent methyltransferase
VDYGLDAPGVLRGFALAGLAALALGVVLAAASGLGAAIAPLVFAATSGATVAAMLRSSRSGKARELERALGRLPWEGDEAVLDVGCGHGVALIAAARRAPRGRAVGVDVWRERDQAHNSPTATLANARDAGVIDRVELVEADARELPFADESFDVVVSSLALHNLPREVGREIAVRQIARVLRPGGRVVILDMFKTAEYVRTLERAGMAGVRRSGLRWSTYPPARIVEAIKPRAGAGAGDRAAVTPPPGEDQAQATAD